MLASAPKSLTLSWEISYLLINASNKGNLIIDNQRIHEAPRPFLGKFIVAYRLHPNTLLHTKPIKNYQKPLKYHKLKTS